MLTCVSLIAGKINLSIERNLADSLPISRGIKDTCVNNANKFLANIMHTATKRFFGERTFETACGTHGLHAH